MISSQHHRLLSSMLLVLTLMVSTWSTTDAMTNNVSGPRDNSLLRLNSKLNSAVVKDRKSDWHAAAVVVGGSSPDRAKTQPTSWTPVCRNYSCPSPGSNPAVQGPGRTQQPDRHPTSADERLGVNDLMRSVSEELSGLRSALQHLRLDSQAIHRQIRRLHRASCAAAKRARRRTRWTGSDKEDSRFQDTGTALL